MLIYIIYIIVPITFKMALSIYEVLIIQIL